METYNALALQFDSPAVNAYTAIDDARASMMAAIERAGALSLSSIRFIGSFSGVTTRLVVLPEYFMTGFPMGESIAGWNEKACVDMDGAEYEALGKVASTCNAYLSGNLYERDPHFPGLYFQTSFILNPSGDVILRYRRLVSMYAPTPHDVLDKYLDIYGADSLFPVVETELGKLACVASEEILYPEITRCLALRGAEVICHSSSEVGTLGKSPKNIAKQARAFENGCYIVSANSGGVSGINFPSQSTDGHSQVVSYDGKVLCEAGFGESMYANAEIHIDNQREFRSRPAMVNCLARQRLELFASTYGCASVYPANTMLRDGEIVVPERAHFGQQIQAGIAALKARGVL